MTTPLPTPAHASSGLPDEPDAAAPPRPLPLVYAHAPTVLAALLHHGSWRYWVSLIDEPGAIGEAARAVSLALVEYSAALAPADNARRALTDNVWPLLTLAAEA